MMKETSQYEPEAAASVLTLPPTSSSNPPPLVDLNDNAIVSICRGDEKSASVFLKRALGQLSLLEQKPGFSYSQYRAPGVSFRPPSALTISIKEYSKTYNDPNKPFVDMSELSSFRSPDTTFEMFDYTFAVALSTSNPTDLIMHQLFSSVLQFNAALAHHRLAVKTNDIMCYELAEDLYFSTVNTVRRLYTSSELQSGKYAATVHTLHLLLLATFNNLGHLSDQIGADMNRLQDYHERMKIVFSQTDVDSMTANEYMFFFLAVSSPPTQSMAAAA